MPRIPLAKANGPKIKELRALKGWTQEVLAEVADLSVRQIQEMENSAFVGGSCIKLVADAFGINDNQVLILEIRTGREKSIPRKPDEPLPAIEDDQYELAPAIEVVPATRKDIEWIEDLAKSVYDGDDRIPVKVMQDWWDANENIFSIIKYGEKRVGNLDVIPLKPRTLQVFEEGRLLEKYIVPDSSYDPSESDKIVDLYVESFVCPGHGIAEAVVLFQLEQLIGRLCNAKQVKRLLAIAASGGGKNILNNLGFNIKGKAQGHNLYVASYEDVLKNRGPVINKLLAIFANEENQGGPALAMKPKGL